MKVLNLNTHHGKNSRGRLGQQVSRIYHLDILKRYGGVTVIVGRFLATDLDRTFELLLYTLHS